MATSGAQGNGASSAASLSDDGRYVTFSSTATTLVPNDTNSQADIFVRDRELGTTQRVNLGIGGEQALGGTSSNASISNDGQVVQFTSSAINLIGLDTNDQSDVFVHDRKTNMTTRVSVASNGAQAAGGASSGGVMTPDGRYIAFASAATNLVTSDTNAATDVFLHDRQTGTTQRVSLTNGGLQATGSSGGPSLSVNGQVVAFVSSATNIVASDSNGKIDVFVRDLQAGTTTRVSVGPAGAQGNDDSFSPMVSGDGRFVVFDSRATNLVPNGGSGTYLHDRTTGVTSALNINPVSTQTFSAPRITRDGRHVCYSFRESATALNQLFVVDVQTLAKIRVDSGTGVGSDLHSLGCAINGDATLAAFDTRVPLVQGDTNNVSDVFLRTLFASVATDQAALRFGAVTSGATFVSQTAPQTVRLTQGAGGRVTWTATSNQPWLQVSPASGTGSATLSIGVVPAAGLPSSGSVTGSISIALTGALNALPPIAVTLTLTPNGTAMGPFGTVDTPADNRTGVTGAIPFTGWALDDIEVTRVSLCRDVFGAEVAPIDPNCGGAAGIFVGFAVFIDGARPDVAVAFPAVPLATRAGWGFMVLTNFLPNQGTGTYRFTMRAQDREGNWFVPRNPDDDVCECQRDVAVRHDRHARAGRSARLRHLHQLWLGPDAAAEDDSDRRLDDSCLGGWRRRRHGGLQPSATRSSGVVSRFQ